MRIGCENVGLTLLCSEYNFQLRNFSIYGEQMKLSKRFDDDAHTKFQSMFLLERQLLLQKELT